MTNPLPDHGTETETLARRIDQLRQELDLERRRRGRLERFGAIACLLVIGAGGIAATAFQPVADVVRTRRLEIVDESNRIVMLASAAKHGGRIDLWDDAGINSARLGGNGTGGDDRRPDNRHLDDDLANRNGRHRRWRRGGRRWRWWRGWR